MGHRLEAKAMTCLRLAGLDKTSAEWEAKYEEACDRYSEKAIIAMFESLVARGYIECGVSARTGWLTKKGLACIEEFGV